MDLNVDIMVPPNTRTVILRMLRRAKLAVEIIIPDVQKLDSPFHIPTDPAAHLPVTTSPRKIMESEKKSRSDFDGKILRDSASSAFFNFREYQSYETVHSELAPFLAPGNAGAALQTRRFLRSIEFAYPKLARVYTIGTSHEGRPIEVIKVA